MIKIAFDIDGVISETYPWIEKTIHDFGYEVDKEVSYGEYLITLKGVDGHAETAKIMNKVLEHVFTKYNDVIMPCNFVGYYLPKIVEMTGGSVTFITARISTYKDITNEWLDKWFNFDYGLVHCGSKNKVQWLVSHKYDCIVEDRLQTANECAKAGLGVFLINARYNVNRFTEGSVVRIDSLRDLYLHLLI